MIIKTLDQKGFSHILLMAIVALGIIAAVIFYVTMYKPSNRVSEELYTNESTQTSEPSSNATLQEPQGTPEEINNEVIDELDSVMLDLEETNLTDDDINSL